MYQNMPEEVYVGDVCHAQMMEIPRQNGGPVVVKWWKSGGKVVDVLLLNHWQLVCCVCLVADRAYSALF